jgi:hypothetical protein
MVLLADFRRNAIATRGEFKISSSKIAMQNESRTGEMTMKIRTIVLLTTLTLTACSKIAGPSAPNEQQLRRTFDGFMSTIRFAPGVIKRLKAAGPAAPIMANEPNTIRYPFVWDVSLDPSTLPPGFPPQLGDETGTASFTKGADGA